MPVSKRIKALLDFSRAPDGDVHVRGLCLYDGLKDNPNFPKPPVGLEVLKAAVDEFGALMAESIHRDRRVIAEKNRQRDKVTSMITEIGHYVEAIAQEGFSRLPFQRPGSRADNAHTVGAASTASTQDSEHRATLHRRIARLHHTSRP